MILSLIMSLLIIGGCSKTSETVIEDGTPAVTPNNNSSLAFGPFSLNMSKEEIISQMGKPTSEEAKDDLTEIFYKGEKGPNATFLVGKNGLVKATWYPSVYDGKTAIPKTKEDIEKNYTGKYTTEKVDCYETAKSTNYIVKQDKTKIEMTLDWEDKIIDRVILE
ncbi:hypothetical protein YDYSY3_47490 [Paenibacillus chitinolyticus]|uniref:hypothetical protein n=1 Tax=Paenibacillus chitinolyticus TaxID=79263 RepID=UPI0026E50260|nr:hypothetical protein [Paenibacillus chitinolyticus]GKS13749.1 hypothetical protein YDYSY3_47490 [Paenibacillus chitinolyticus]